MLALTTSGSDSSKTPFQPNLTAFLPKKPEQAISQKPVTLVDNKQQQYPTGLIETTDIQQRLKQLQQRQSDPFTRLFPPQLETATKPEKVFPDLPKLTVKKELPVATVKPTVKVQPNTLLAKGVAVEGVVQIGDETHAIVKLPTDGTSRYVSEGQLLSGGQLLVKRIEISPDSEPMVILEQNGIEVAKTVGETDDTDTIASSTLSQIDNEKEASDEQASSSETSTEVAAKPVKATQPTEEYTAPIPGINDIKMGAAFKQDPRYYKQTIQYKAAPIFSGYIGFPVPSPQSRSYSNPKESFYEAKSPPPTNSDSSTNLATSKENFPNSELSSTTLVSNPSDRTPEQVGQNSFADQQNSSKFDFENQPHTASSNIEGSTRLERLVDRLRLGNKPPVGNRIETNSRQALQTNLRTQAAQQQPISDQLGYKKPKATSNELTTSSNIEVLAHRQRLINELRRTIAHTNN